MATKLETMESEGTMSAETPQSRDTVRFVLNGEPRVVSAPDPNATLLNYLRYEARLTGTKEGCAEGDCGACTVAIVERDGAGVRWKPVNACIHFLAMVDGREVLTIEGLRAPDGALHPVQKCFVDRHAAQCGFCTPGFLMSLAVARHQNRLTSRHEVEDAVAGNLCRCTGYGPIIDAALDAGVLEEPAHIANCDPARRERLDVIAADAPLAIRTHDKVTQAERRYYAPRSVDELSSLYLRRPDAMLLAGGTDVALRVTKEHQSIATIIALQEIPELRHISDEGEYFWIGAAATYGEAEAALASAHPAITALFRRLGATQIRAMGTIGGNIANGSPIGDSMPALIAARARLRLRRGQNERTIPLEDYFLDYGRQDRQPGEFVIGVELPRPAPDVRFSISKLSKRFDQDISTVCGAFALEIEGDHCRGARIAFGGMAGIPKRASRCEGVLENALLDGTTLDRAVAALREDFEPLSDMRGSAAYRRRGAEGLLRRAWIEATETGVKTRLVR